MRTQVLRVVKGEPTAEELAALVTVLAARAAARGPQRTHNAPATGRHTGATPAPRSTPARVSGERQHIRNLQLGRTYTSTSWVAHA